MCRSLTLSWPCWGHIGEFIKYGQIKPSVSSARCRDVNMPMSDDTWYLRRSEVFPGVAISNENARPVFVTLRVGWIVVDIFGWLLVVAGESVDVTRLDSSFYLLQCLNLLLRRMLDYWNLSICICSYRFGRKIFPVECWFPSTFGNADAGRSADSLRTMYMNLSLDDGRK